MMIISLLKANTMTEMPSSNTNRGFTLSALQGTFRITRNRFNLNLTSEAIYIQASNGTSATQSFFANNMISLTGNTSSTGIQFNGASNQNIGVYNNSIYNTSSSPASYGIYLNSSCQNITLRNNSIYGNSGYALLKLTSASNISSDYNNYYDAGGVSLINWNSTIYNTLAAFQAGTTQDSNSISVDPLYVSSSDLHLQIASPNIEMGTTLAQVPDDFDEELRPIPAATSYDIGADERDGCPVIQDTSMLTIVDGDTAFIGSSAYTTAGTYVDTLTASNGCDSIAVTILDVMCAPLAGVYTIGGVSPDFPTIDSSVQAMILCGIDAAVVFNIRDGIYTEQTSIPAISGSSAANTITYRSENGDTSLVEWNWPSSASPANNYVCALDGTSYLRFQNITVRRTGNLTYAHAFVLPSTCNDIRWDTMQIIVESTTGDSTQRINILSNSTAYDSLFVMNSKIRGASHNIRIHSLTAFDITNVFIRNNHIQGDQQQVFLQNVNNFEISDNLFTRITTAGRAIYVNDGDGPFLITRNQILYPDGKIGTSGIFISSTEGIGPDQSLISNNFVQMITAPAAAVRIAAAGGPNGKIGFYNNTVFVGNTHTALRIDAGSDSIFVYNNILYKYTSGLALTSQVGATNIFSDYNLLYKNSGTNLTNWNGVTYTSLAAHQVGTGMDLNSIEADPEFVSDTNLHLTSCSPAINAGVTLPAVPDDYDKDVRPFAFVYDMGADENICTPIYATINDTICNGDSIVYFGKSYTMAGTYMDTLCGVAPGNCDSIFTINITVPPTIQTNANVTACDSALREWNMVLQLTQVINDTFVGANLCDSIHTTNLTINNAVYTNGAVTACDSALVNGTWYYSSHRDQRHIYGSQPLRLDPHDHIDDQQCDLHEWYSYGM